MLWSWTEWDAQRICKELCKGCSANDMQISMLYVSYKLHNVLQNDVWFLRKIRSVRILCMIVCSRTVLWAFGCSLLPWTLLNSPWKMASSVLLQSSDPTDLGSTTDLLLQDLSLTQNTCVPTNGNKASLLVCLSYNIYCNKRFNCTLCTDGMHLLYVQLAVC